MLPRQRGTGEIHDHQSNSTENTAGYSREREKYQDSRNSGREASMNGAENRMKKIIRQLMAKKEHNRNEAEKVGYKL